MLAGRDLPYVAAGGTDEPAASRVERLKRELAAAEAEVTATPVPADGPLVPEAPVRRSGEEGKQEEPGPLDQSIPALETHLGTLNDVEELRRLRAAEEGGKSRSGALAAIDARLEELDA
jgi:hypothetical protein